MKISKAPPAQLLTQELPGGWTVYWVDCAFARTSSTVEARAIAMMGEAGIFRVTLTRHELECGKCSTAAAWDQLRDEPMTLEEAAHLGVQLRRAYARERRN